MAKRRKKRGRPAPPSTPRRAKPPFPINLIFNVRAFYLFFIVVMIASLAAVGLAPGFGGGSRRAPAVEEETPLPGETPVVGESYKAPEPTIDASQPHRAIIQTSDGPIEIQLYTDAPQAVNSFAFLAKEGFYDGLYFFYVNKGFVAQAGDPTCAADLPEGTVCTGSGGPGYTLPVEETAEGHQQWAVVAPAIIEGQEVHGSQFRILFRPDPRLDGRETVFGKVVKGQEILEGLEDFIPCSVAQVEGCDPHPDWSSALKIEKVTVEAL